MRQTWIVFNSVFIDGSGDFAHFEDIIQTLRNNPEFKNIELIALIWLPTYHKNFKIIEERIKSIEITLSVQCYYGNTNAHENFSTQEALISKLKVANQAIVISYDTIFQMYQPHFEPDIPIKLIAEHEGNTIGGIFGRSSEEKIFLKRNLGLGKKCFGIKLKNSLRQTSVAAWRDIEKNDPDFASQLLSHTNANDFAAFEERNILVPAYFNDFFDFFTFLRIFEVNPTILANKNLIIYLSSGKRINEFIYRKKEFEKYSQNISQIEIVRPEKQTADVMTINKNGMLSIKVFSGYRISEPSFNAIYHLAPIAGVSGDNTLERCISMNVLPSYWSTNSNAKRETLEALHEMTQLPEIVISEKARKSFKIYFDSDSYLIHSDSDKYDRNPYRDIDFPAMIDAWPKITAYLKQYANFYHNLESIVLESLPESKSTPINMEQSRKQSAISKKTLFLFQLQQHDDEMVKNQPHLTSPHLTSPHLTSPHLTSQK